jgi:phage tail sheath protein FI
MPAFNAINKTPNVYIMELDVPGPIAGVATSIAAFVGPAKAGPINVPTLVTNWTQFINSYGLPDSKGNQDPYIYSPPLTMAHAVKGFFDNGGAMCWISRAGTGAPATLTLLDQAGKDVLVVSSLTDGGNGIQVAVTASSLAAGVLVAKQEITIPGATASGQKLVKAASAGDASKFMPGDAVLISDGAGNEQATIASISADTITLSANLANNYAAGAKVRIADLKIGQTRIRLASTAKFEAGTYVKVAQGGTSDLKVVSSVEPATSTIVLASGLANAYSLDGGAANITVDTLEFTLKIDATTYANLSMDPRHSRYFANIVQADPLRTVSVALKEPVPLTPPPNNLPVAVSAPLAGGQADDPSALTTAQYLTALDALQSLDQVNILCIPDATGMSEADQLTIQKAMITQCENKQDRFAILDPRPGASPSDITAYRQQLNSDHGYAALYYPRIVINHPTGNGTLTVPPSGHIAGVYARTDDQKGVHKAPANETISNVQGLEIAIGDSDHGPLNENSINVIRAFAGRGIRIWGARTLSSFTQWRYINVRRLMIFVENSIQTGTQFAVFEPNNTELWQRLKRTVGEFLDRVWKSGALLGDKPDEAYRVRIDDELNPPATIALGQLVIEVRVAPTTPAEFVIFQIIQQPGTKIIDE